MLTVSADLLPPLSVSSRTSVLFTLDQFVLFRWKQQ